MNRLVITILCGFIFVADETASAADIGPDNGVLVIVGGAAGPDILKEFVDLAGGPDAPIVVIPTASGASTYDRFHRVARQFREAFGVSDVVVLHTPDRRDRGR